MVTMPYPATKIYFTDPEFLSHEETVSLKRINKIIKEKCISGLKVQHIGKLQG